MAKRTHQENCQTVLDVIYEQGPMRFRLLATRAQLPIASVHAAIHTLKEGNEIHVKREENIDVYYAGPEPRKEDEEEGRPDVYHVEIAPGHRIVRFGKGYRAGHGQTADRHRSGASSLWTIYK